MSWTRRARWAETDRTDAFVAAIRASAHPRVPVAPAARTDTVAMPRIVTTQATPPGGWARARQELCSAMYRQAVAG